GGAERVTASCNESLRGGELGVLQRQPLGAFAGEAHLHPRVEPPALEIDDHALAELRVLHVLPDGERVLVGALHLEAGALRCRGIAAGIGCRGAAAAGSPASGPAAPAPSPVAEGGRLAAVLELLL